MQRVRCLSSICSNRSRFNILRIWMRDKWGSLRFIVFRCDLGVKQSLLPLSGVGLNGKTSETRIYSHSLFLPPSSRLVVQYLAHQSCLDIICSSSNQIGWYLMVGSRACLYLFELKLSFQHACWPEECMVQYLDVGGFSVMLVDGRGCEWLIGTICWKIGSIVKCTHDKWWNG